ncbi:ABC transporter ATP-binding protein [Streptomyces collinus]|uniref:ABC transporter ATP-binding protein n=1 Tax=Streptomyces collinus TaxID=42684 RepID=UPI0036BD34D8
MTGIVSGLAVVRWAGWSRRLAGYAGRYRWTVLLTLAASLGLTAVLTAAPLITKGALDAVGTGHSGAVAGWAGLLVAAAVAFSGLSVLRRFCSGRLQVDVQRDLFSDLHAAMMRLDGRQQDTLSTGQFMTRATSDLRLVQNLLMMAPAAVGDILQFVLALAMMALLSLPLTVITLLVVPVLWLLARRSRSRLVPATSQAQEQAAAVAGVVDGAVAGVRVVRAFGQEGREVEQLRGASRGLFAARMRVVRLNAVFTPLLQVVPALGQVAVLALGGWLAVHGRISLGTFVAFSAYLTQLAGVVQMLAGVLTVGQQAGASMERLLELIDAEPVIQDGTTDLPPGGALAVEFDRVAFAYQEEGRPVLNGLSLTLRPGETVAVMGALGSGKTSLTQLLLRFYDPTAGTIHINGHSIRDLTLHSLRAATALVSEDSFLFSGTIRSNIAYGHPRATDAQVRAAAEAARAHTFVSQLPQGYDTEIGERGLTLSGGQRQRIALARALLTNPRLLVLDDPASAVDPRTEQDIHQALKTAAAGRTTLLIARRPSTLRLADRIAVIAHGRLADIGTHHELHDRCPLYRTLLTYPSQPPDTTPRPTRPRADTRIPADPPEITESSRPAEPDRNDHQLAGAKRCAGDGAGRLRHRSRRHRAAGPHTPGLATAAYTPDIDEARAAQMENYYGLRRLLRGFGRPLSLAVALVAAGAVAELLFPALVQRLVDRGIQQHSLAAVWVACGLTLLVTLGQWAAQVGEIRTAGRMGERLLYMLRVKIFAQLQRLALDYYARQPAGQIMTRMTTDVDTLSAFLQTGLATSVICLLTFFGGLLALFTVDWQLALLALAVLPALTVVTILFRRRSSLVYGQARDRIGDVNASLQETLAGLRIVQACNRQEATTGQFAQRLGTYRRARIRGERLISFYFPCIQLLSWVAEALVLAVGATRIQAGTLTTGALIACLFYLEMLTAPVQQLSQIFASYQQAAVSLRRIRQLLQEPVPTETPGTRLPAPRLQGEITFNRVHFSYPRTTDERAAALAGINLHIPAGQTVAIVGESGAGKSTLLNLAARFHDPTQGRITIDGIDLNTLDPTSYRHRLGIVPQEAYLFEGTVRDNIAYGRPLATDPEIEAAARAVGAHQIISTLDRGYLHTVTAGGRNLSAGQRQLLALARAELTHPDILLLDEATAALDAATEHLVHHATQALTRHRTTLLVAHRLTTAARADRIIVLQDGCIIEDGTHSSLLKENGHYSALWHSHHPGPVRKTV